MASLSSTLLIGNVLFTTRYLYGTIMTPKERSRLVFPGERLCHDDNEHSPGPGTYVQQGVIFSSILGYPEFSQASETDQTQVVSVKRQTKQLTVPSAGDIVTARVVSVNPRFCKCTIVCVKNIVLQEHFRGLLRKEDVRATQQDTIQMYKCFRPGDVILARVLSLGDSFSYLLSTAENELGVVIAHSEAGVPLVPISWTEMQCPKTYQKESRKVAKVLSEKKHEAVGKEK